MLKNGAQLRYPIRDKRGLLLMVQGAVVTNRLRQILETRGISLELQASLKLLEGERAGVEIPIKTSPFKIGRLPDCELQLASPVVSKYHCHVHKRPDGVFLEDLQSMNGTFLNRQRLTGETELNDNDSIRVGHFLFTVQIYAALAADSGVGEKVLNAWILEETSPKGQPASPYCPTDPDVDLDNLSHPRAT
jgi:pSer/pThr/pTyr-binding forkhead associated (FHA) protein